jgi:transcription elongation GreA/GreB family factor
MLKQRTADALAEETVKSVAARWRDARGDLDLAEEALGRAHREKNAAEEQLSRVEGELVKALGLGEKDKGKAPTVVSLGRGEAALATVRKDGYVKFELVAVR